MRLISIQSAIEALEKEKPTPYVNKDGSIDPFGAGRQNQWYRDGIAIMNLPSVQQWVSVTERLPEENTDVLVTYVNGEETRIIPVNYGQGTWFDCIFNVKLDSLKITAWMPLPEPWKGE